MNEVPGLVFFLFHALQIISSSISTMTWFLKYNIQLILYEQVFWRWNDVWEMLNADFMMLPSVNQFPRIYYKFMLETIESTNIFCYFTVMQLGPIYKISNFVNQLHPSYDSFWLEMEDLWCKKDVTNSICI